MIKTHILFDLKEGPTGGGNQFMKALRDYLRLKNAYAEKLKDADVVMFNSYQHILQNALAKIRHPKKIFVHRIDGPIRLYNSMTDKRDKITNTANEVLAEATIFQSDWSREQNYRLGLKKNKLETTIMNAPNPKIFTKKTTKPEGKIKLIATSWSANKNKGFDVYKWLDKNLDFTKVEMIFYGNSPYKFKHIKTRPAVNSKELANALRQHDIFITASKKDPCSNSLIEALHSGLPAVALHDGGHPEIIGEAGETFKKKEEIPELIQKIIKNYSSYQKKIKLPGMEEQGRKYHDFLTQTAKLTPKKLRLNKFIKLMLLLRGL